jgi:hypothetical protein
VPLVESFLASDRLAITPAVFQDDARRRRILLTLNMNRIVRHSWEAIRHENTQALAPVFDSERPARRARRVDVRRDPARRLRALDQGGLAGAVGPG